jgi:hypothetical protein
MVATATMVSANWDPPAITIFPSHEKLDTPDAVHALIQDGRALFTTKFNIIDGAGRPGSTGDSKPTPRSVSGMPFWHRLAGPDANSCAGCHNQPIIGGSGEFVANVFVGAHQSDPPTESISPDATNERNTLSILGAGAIEMLAREMSRDLRSIRNEGLRIVHESGKPQTVKLITKGIDFGTLHIRSDGTIDTSGMVGIDNDLIIRPFGVKGVAASIREFTLFALNQHHGIQAIERFGWERTGLADHDGDGVEIEFTIGQVDALVAFQADLKAPGRNPENKDDPAVKKGAQLFTKIGCANCHRPTLPLESTTFTEPSEFNRPGALTPEDSTATFSIDIQSSSGSVEPGAKGGLLVSAYTDLKRHTICDDDISFLCNERIRQDGVPVDQFLTSKLWDLKLSAPYCHRGDCSTLSEAILYHGGEARNSRDQFLELPDSEKRILIKFLLSLGDG